MNQQLFRHVLFKDLEGYIRKKDYMSGYTDSEKEYIKKNLGIDVGQSNTKTLSYEALYMLCRKNNLSPGYIYIINNFKTIYQSNEIRNNKHITYGSTVNESETYDIAVMAATNSNLFSNALILQHPTWDVKYNIQQHTYEDGQKDMGRIYYLQDDNKNRASYDFKNVRFKYNNKLFYTFDNNGIENSNNCFNNDITDCNGIIFKYNCYDNIIRGNNIVVNQKLSTFVGELNNVLIQTDIDLNDNTIKQSIQSDGNTLIQYFDIESLTYQYEKISKLNYELANNTYTTTRKTQI